MAAMAAMVAGVAASGAATSRAAVLGTAASRVVTVAMVVTVAVEGLKPAHTKTHNTTISSSASISDGYPS